MRAIAAFSILTYHVWFYGAPSGLPVDLGAASKAFDNMRAGVTLFFVLSGFLLFRPYVASALRAGPTPSVGKYFRNRALRILPAYWTILIVVALVVDHQLLRAPQQLLANAFLAQNYVQGYIFGPGIVPAWSLAVEVVFYACVPVLGLLAIQLARRGRLSPLRAAYAPVVLMIAIGFGAKAALRIHPALGQVWEVAFPIHADWFAGGMALAVLRARWEDGHLHLPRYWRTPSFLFAIGFGALSAKFYYSGQLSYVEYQTPIVVSCTILLALVVFAEPGSKLVSVLTWRPIAAAGIISYSVFLWQDPLLRLLRMHGLTRAGALGFVGNLLEIAAITALLSTISYLCVERPALSRKRAWIPGSRSARAQPPPGGGEQSAPLLDGSDLRPARAAGG